MNKTAIFIADDHELVRAGLRSLIDNESVGFEVVGEAANGREAARQVRQLQPDIVLMDIMMPELNGIEAIQQITSESKDVAVIAVSARKTSEAVSQVLSAGAAGYLHKDSTFSELVDALNAVIKGNVYLGKTVANSLVNDYQRLASGVYADREPGLSPREREVLQLVAEGNRTLEIAEKMSIGVKTVETHRGQIMRKLNLNGIAEMTHYAIRKGIVSL